MGTYDKKYKKHVTFMRPFKQFVSVQVPAGANYSLLDILTPEDGLYIGVVAIQPGANTTFSEFTADGVELGGFVGPNGYREFDFKFFYSQEILVENKLQGRFNNTGAAAENVSFTVYGWKVKTGTRALE